MILILPIVLGIIITLIYYHNWKFIYRQTRIGFKNKPFTIYKFKTMFDIKLDKPIIDDIDRVTPIGKILRKFHLDEIPQLINIINGEMGFIGPRPLLPEYLEFYSERQKLRHEVLPGLTGLSQIKTTPLDSWEERLEWDCVYVESIKRMDFISKFRLDIEIVLKTILQILSLKTRKLNPKEFERFMGSTKA